MFVHRCYLAQLKSQLKTLLKLKLFLRVLKNVLIRNHVVKIRAISVQTSSILEKKATVLRSAE